jgi:hypothetical protein
MDGVGGVGAPAPLPLMTRVTTDKGWKRAVNEPMARIAPRCEGRVNVIKITLKGLANFMAAAPAKQRKILRDFKYPKPEGVAQAKYYGPARQTISAYHRHDHLHEWLEQQAHQLLSLATDVPTEAVATKLRSNARAIAVCEDSWSRKKVECCPTPTSI